MRVTRPASITPAAWAALPRGVRLAVASREARTPERRDALRAEALRHFAAQLERTVRTLERAVKGERRQDDG